MASASIRVGDGRLVGWTAGRTTQGRSTCNWPHGMEEGKRGTRHAAGGNKRTYTSQPPPTSQRRIRATSLEEWIHVGRQTTLASQYPLKWVAVIRPINITISKLHRATKGLAKPTIRVITSPAAASWNRREGRHIHPSPFQTTVIKMMAGQERM